MRDTYLRDILLDNPVIAAVRNDEELSCALESDIELIFVLYGTLLTISKISEKLTRHHKKFFIHLDLIEGLKGDSEGIEFIKRSANPLGIITTKPSNIRYANHLGLMSIQRIFIIDSLSLKTGIANINTVNPSAVEIMPGLCQKSISIINKETSASVIAGGLINSKNEVFECLSAGALAVSTTEKKLWNDN
ncbi:glycerol-3-phosphate responsive antiterminator [Clostridium cadaveris]